VPQIAAVFALVALTATARADIFQWEYDPFDGTKVQSTALAPDGAGVDPVPGADLGFHDQSFQAVTLRA
jgi:hypothetical protein